MPFWPWHRRRMQPWPRTYRRPARRPGSHCCASSRATRWVADRPRRPPRSSPRISRRAPGRFSPRPMPKVIFIERDGNRREVDAPLGLSVLEIAHKNGIDIEGACEGSLACSTCHVIVDPEWYDLLKDATEDEEDMLDLAFGLTVTSRLGCQIIITEELDGLTVRLPAATRNMLLR